MDIKKIPAGKNPPEDIYVVVEIPQDSPIKYELDKETGAVFVDRFLFTAMHYPFNYGFIPSNLGGRWGPGGCFSDIKVSCGTRQCDKVQTYRWLGDEGRRRCGYKAYSGAPLKDRPNL
jgi:inorganic pyrophosphatase